MSLLPIRAPESVGEPMGSHNQVAATGIPQFQPFKNQWLCQQNLEQKYEAQKIKSALEPDPVAKRAVTEMDLSRFQFLAVPPDRYPSPACGSLFSTGAPSGDLSFLLENFLAVDPVEDPNALYARIAAREGRGYAPLPQWLRQQGLERDYKTLKLKSMRMIDPVAERAAAEMDLSQFLFSRPACAPETLSLSPSPTHNVGEPLFYAGVQPEDLDFGLKSLLVVDPVGGSDTLYARIAIKEGRATPGYVPVLPPSMKEEGSCKAYIGLG